MPDQKIQKQNVANAGEYYIASRLSALNFIATITLGRAERYDILALSPNGRLLKLSVKATQLENAKDFPLSVKDESGQADDFYYAFVKLNGFKKEPDFWIIPSRVVCRLIKKANKEWMSKPGRNNQKHKSMAMRILPVKVGKSKKDLFPENWNDQVRTYYKNLEQLL